jgi:hypothetical protein
MVYAHSPNNASQPHDLIEHLKSVAEKAAEFAGKFGTADFGYWAVVWPGEILSGFSEYLEARAESSLASDGLNHYWVTAF